MCVLRCVCLSDPLKEITNCGPHIFYCVAPISLSFCAARELYGCNRSKSRAKSRGPLSARYAKWGMLIFAGQPINFHRSLLAAERRRSCIEGRKVGVFGELKALISF